MIYVAYIALLIAFVQLLISLLNLLFQERLPLPKDKNTKVEGSVSVLIPARNEESNINKLLQDLSEIRSGILEIIVFDDDSEDSTAGVVEEFAKRDDRIRLIRSHDLPEGWKGKNYGCHSLAEAARGDYLLFLDADIRLSHDIIERMVKYSLTKQVDLLSIFPTQIMSTLGERITVPNMHYILLSLLLLPLVRRAHYLPSIAAANGQCMFFRAETYHKHLPHLRFKNRRVEDIEIAKYFKKMKYRVSCLTGSKVVKCRMYPSLKTAVAGFSRSIIHSFGQSDLGAIIFWAFTTFGFIPVILCTTTPLIAAYFGSMILTRIFVSFVARQNVFVNLFLLIPQQLLLGVFIFNAIFDRKKTLWKGRHI